MRGADGIWSLGGNFWGEAGRGKMLRAHARRVFFFFFENAGVAFLGCLVPFPSFGPSQRPFLGLFGLIISNSTQRISIFFMFISLSSHLTLAPPSGPAP